MNELKQIFSPEKLFFSSDWHLCHTNVLKYDNRPFKNINEMNEIILDNHNRTVSNDSNFFFLGDAIFTKNKNDIDFWLKQFKGNLFFIKGNHDHTPVRKAYEKFGIYLGEQISNLKVGTCHDDAQNIVLNHFKMAVWDKSHHGSFHLYGHSHGSAEHMVIGKSMDVGIMQNNYYPFSYKLIKQILDKRPKQTFDHHTGER